MTPELAEKLQSVRFVVGPDGVPTDALLGIEVWQALMECFEDIEDTQLVRDMAARLKAAGGDPERAGLVPWQQAEADLQALGD